MIREPKMLSWLAKKAGVPLPVAKAIWQEVVKNSQTDPATLSSGDAAWRQVRAFRHQLDAWAKGRRDPQKGAGWVLPVPVYRAWTDCQTRVLRSTWLAWARATRTTYRLPRLRCC